MGQIGEEELVFKLQAGKNSAITDQKNEDTLHLFHSDDSTSQEDHEPLTSEVVE